MKKILLTVCLSAVFALGAMAQQQEYKKTKGTKEKQRTEQQGEMKNTSDSEQTEAARSWPDIEVVEGKEGPNNEIVYKFQGDLYYVDREEKKFVKIDKEDLKDSKHEVVVHEGTATRESSKDRNRRSKG